MNEQPRLIRNAFKTPDGTIIESRSVHDYVTHEDRLSREVYMTDGGLSYIRCSLNKVPAESLCLYDNEPHEVQREVIKWGSYGKNGDQPLRLIPVGEMETDHILAVLRECSPAYVYKNCMIEELKQRGVPYEKEEIVR